MFCEEFQVSLLKNHHSVFDKYRNKSILYGELVWNFQDFMTAQGKNIILIMAVALQL